MTRMTTGQMAQTSGGWSLFGRGEGCAMLIGVTIGSAIFGIIPGVVAGIMAIPSGCALDLAL